MAPTISIALPLVIVLVLLSSHASSLPNSNANSNQDRLIVRIINYFEQAAVESAECDVTRRIGNRAMNKIFILFDRTVTNVPSVDWFKRNYCDNFKAWHRQLFAYRKCLKPSVRSVFNFVMGDIKDIYNRFCLNDNEMNVAFEHLKCMDNETKPEIMEISDMIHKGISHISRLNNPDDILPTTCCGINLILDEMHHRLTKLCPTKSPPDTPEFAVNFFKTVLSDIEIWCGKYPTTQSCNEQLPDMMRDINREFKNATPVYESFMIPWWNVLLRLDEAVNFPDNPGNTD